MINGSRCTRACGFCLVDTQQPEPINAEEPHHVAQAVEQMGLSHVVITAVARDDLDDGSPHLQRPRPLGAPRRVRVREVRRPRLARLGGL